METQVEKNLIRRQISIAVVADFLAGTAASVFSFAAGLYILKKTGSPVAFGTVQMIGPLIGLLLSPVIGKVTDTNEHKHVIIGAQLIAFVAFVLYGLAIWLVPNSFYVATLIVLTIARITETAAQNAYQATVVSLVPIDHVQRLAGLEQSAFSLAGIIGPVLGGIIFALAPFEVAVGIQLFDILTVAAASLLLNFHAYEQPAHHHAPADEQVASQEGYFALIRRVVKDYPGLAFTFFLAPGVNFFFSFLNTGLPVAMLTQLKMNSQTMGVVEAGIGIGAVIGGLLIAHHHTFAKPLLITFISVLVLSVPIFMNAITTFIGGNNLPTAIAFFVAFVLDGIIISFANTPMGAFNAKQIPQREQGRIFALIGGIAQAASPIAILLVSFLLTFVNAALIFLIAGLGILVYIAFVWKFVGQRENLRVNRRVAELEALSNNAPIEA